jgi:hypothetical protein
VVKLAREILYSSIFKGRFGPQNASRSFALEFNLQEFSEQRFMAKIKYFVSNAAAALIFAACIGNAADKTSRPTVGWRGYTFATATIGTYLATKAEALKNWPGTGCDVKASASPTPWQRCYRRQSAS